MCGFFAIISKRRIAHENIEQIALHHLEMRGPDGFNSLSREISMGGQTIKNADLLSKFIAIDCFLKNLQKNGS